MTSIKNLIKLLIIKFKFKNIKLNISSNIHLASTLKGYNTIGSNTWFEGEIGRYSYIGNNCVISAKIGNFCSIANNVYIIKGTHPTDFVSTSPVFYSNKKSTTTISFTKNNLFKEEKYTKHSCNIGHDVWIGFGATILPGLNIGTGAIIGAGSIVTKDVEAYSIVAGNPAKIIRYRFSKENISFLLSSKWWDHDHTWFMANHDSFKSIELFRKGKF